MWYNGLACAAFMAFLYDLRIQLHVLIYGPIEAVCPVSRKRPPNIGVMMVHCLRRSPSIDSTYVFVGCVVILYLTLNCDDLIRY